MLSKKLLSFLNPVYSSFTDTVKLDLEKITEGSADNTNVSASFDFSPGTPKDIIHSFVRTFKELTIDDMVSLNILNINDLYQIISSRNYSFAIQNVKSLEILYLSSLVPQFNVNNIYIQGISSKSGPYSEMFYNNRVKLSKNLIIIDNTIWNLFIFDSTAKNLKDCVKFFRLETGARALSRTLIKTFENENLGFIIGNQANIVVDLYEFGDHLSMRWFNVVTHEDYHRFLPTKLINSEDIRILGVLPKFCNIIYSK